MKIYQAIATALQAKQNCEASGNEEWRMIWADRITYLCRNHLPSGAGVDGGTPIDWDKSRPERLTFLMAFHHMDECGGYSGWSYHSAIVTASLTHGFDIRMTGRDRNGIKDYLAETLHGALSEEAPAWEVID